MNAAAFTLVESLGRTSLWLFAATIAATLVLRVARVRSPAVHRAAWVAALAVGWTFLRWPLGVPWYDAASPANVAVIEMPRELAPTTHSEPIIELAPGGGPVAPVPTLLDNHDALSPHEMMPPESLAMPSAMPAPASAEPVDRPPAWQVDWAIAVAALWLLGVMAIVGRWALGYMRFVRAIGRIPPADDRWSQAWARLAAEAGVRRPAGLRIARAGAARLPRRGTL